MEVRTICSGVVVRRWFIHGWEERGRIHCTQDPIIILKVLIVIIGIYELGLSFWIFEKEYVKLGDQNNMSAMRRE